MKLQEKIYCKKFNHLPVLLDSPSPSLSQMQQELCENEEFYIEMTIGKETNTISLNKLFSGDTGDAFGNTFEVNNLFAL